MLALSCGTACSPAWKGDTRRAQEAFAAAARHLRRGLASSGGYVRGEADIRLDLATHAMAVGRSAEARAALLSARELARRIGTRFHLADASIWLESAAGVGLRPPMSARAPR